VGLGATYNLFTSWIISILLILIYPKVKEKIGNGKKNHLRMLA
jgi:hypothetical protein